LRGGEQAGQVIFDGLVHDGFSGGPRGIR
jgi:hypothetical protein